MEDFIKQDQKVLKNKFIEAIIEYDYSREYYCDQSGCNDEGICRCSSIVDINLKSVDLLLITDLIYSDFLPSDKISRKREMKISEILYGGETVDRYCIYRILSINKVYFTYNWELNIVGGYYGQETDGFFMDSSIFSKINSQISFLFSLDNISDKLKYVIELEYGRLSDVIKDSDFEIISIYKTDIDRMSLNKNHLLDVKQEDISHYSRNSYNLPRGIVKKTNNGYSIIDGYHRIEVISDRKLFEVFLVKK
jgi:hypothetical protein